MKTNKTFEEGDKTEVPLMKREKKNTAAQGKKSVTVLKAVTMKKTRAILKERKRKLVESSTRNLHLFDKKQVTLKNTTIPEKKSVRVLKPSLPKPVAMKTETTPSEVTKPVAMGFTKPTVKACVAKPMSTMKLVQPLQVRLHATELKATRVNDLIAAVSKTHHKVRESQRAAARLALDQMVPTVAFEDHLSYHRELEQLGCNFIQHEIHLLETFGMLSRDNNH